MKTIDWNPWRGCKTVSSGCIFCKYNGDNGCGIYRNRRDFKLPIRKHRKNSNSEKYEMEYNIESGTIINVCTESDFFISETDFMRKEAWDIIHQRKDCLFHIVTRRPERIAMSLPELWLGGWDNVMISVAVEDNITAWKRIPYLINLCDNGLKHMGIIVSPMTELVDFRPFLSSGFIEHLWIGGESYIGYKGLARTFELYWVDDVKQQCDEYEVNFKFITTGSRLRTYNGNIIGVKKDDQEELAKFYSRHNKSNIESVYNNWQDNIEVRELQFRAEEAYKIFSKLQAKEKK